MHVCMYDCFIFQHVKKPTRYREGETPNILDLVLTNEEGTTDTIDHYSGLGKSDHECLIFELKCYKETREKTNPTRDYFKGDYEKIANTLDDNDWLIILQGEISVSYDNLCSVLEQTVTDNIPLKSRRNKKKNLYMNRNAIKMKDRKNELWKRYCRTKSHQDSQKFKRCRDEPRCLTRQLRITFENKLMKYIKKKPKSFWRYANSRLKTRILIPTLIKSEATKADTSLDKAEELNKHFRGVFIPEGTNTIHVPNNYFNGEKLITFTFEFASRRE